MSTTEDELFEDVKYWKARAESLQAELETANTNHREMAKMLADMGRRLKESEQVLRDIIYANQDFRDGMPPEWEGDPLQDAIDKAKALLGMVPAASVGKGELTS